MRHSSASVEWIRRSLRPTLRHAEFVASVVAMTLLVASTVANVLEQSAVDNEGAQAARSGANPGALTTTGGSEIFIGAYGGAPYTYPSDVTVKKAGTHDFTAKRVGWDGMPFDDPIYYGARVARWSANGRSGAMIDFTHSKTLARLKDEVEFSGTFSNAPLEAKKKLGDVFKRLEFSHGHNMLTLNGLMRLPSLGARLSPYAGLGAGVSLPHTEIHLASDNARTYEYQLAGPVAQALIGIEFKLQRMSFFVEYKFSIARNHVPLSDLAGSLLPFDVGRQLWNWFNGVEPPGGSLLTVLASHQVIAGLGVRIKASPGAAP